MLDPKFYMINGKKDWLNMIAKLTKDGYRWSYDQIMTTHTRPYLLMMLL